MHVCVLTRVTKKQNQLKDMYTFRPNDDVRSATLENAGQTGVILAPLICCGVNLTKILVLTIGYNIIKDSVGKTLREARMTACFLYAAQLDQLLCMFYC